MSRDSPQGDSGVISVSPRTSRGSVCLSWKEQGQCPSLCPYNVRSTSRGLPPQSFRLDPKRPHWRSNGESKNKSKNNRPCGVGPVTVVCDVGLKVENLSDPGWFIWGRRCHHFDRDPEPTHLILSLGKGCPSPRLVLQEFRVNWVHGGGGVSGF